VTFFEIYRQQGDLVKIYRQQGDLIKIYRQQGDLIKNISATRRFSKNYIGNKVI